jgi:hypothetical protein
VRIYKPARAKPRVFRLLTVSRSGSVTTAASARIACLPVWPNAEKAAWAWFYGFQLHLVINEQGERLAFALTPGQRDDRRPVKKLVRPLWGKLFGDRGSISQELFEQ